MPVFESKFGQRTNRARMYLHESAENKYSAGENISVFSVFLYFLHDSAEKWLAASAQRK